MVSEANELIVRPAAEADAHDLADMVDDFVRGHPAEGHPRPPEMLRNAYFGREPVARVLVAVRRQRIVGMGQWTRIYDLFWAKYGGQMEWLYVRPDARGIGISAAIVAAICADIRRAGGEYLSASYGEGLAKLYERVAVGSPARSCHVSGEGFQALADLDGTPARQIVRRLPSPELSRAPARSRP
jgi:GNAT superfamily N-acetyltransferase